jgi:class 3 adenylate cyclase
MRRRGRDHVLATLLFTDIVGSSRVAAELGDRRWRALLDRHHAIVRRELKRFHGRELDTAGDGFFAVFDEPSDAIRCACAISDAVRELGIEIRAGLNLGETEVIGGKLGGMAVHAAARIMSLAGPGEVLVSSTVRDLVPGSGVEFSDRGTHTLRDIPQESRLFAATSLDGTPRRAPAEPEQAAERRAAIGPPPLMRRRSGRIGAVAGAIGVLAAAIIVLATHSPASRGPQAAPTSPKATVLGDHLAQIDPVSRKVVHEIAVGGRPSGVAFGEGSVWVTNALDKTVSRVDPVL